MEATDTLGDGRASTPPPHSAQGLFAPPYRTLSIGMIALISMLAFEAIAVAAGMPAVAEALDGLSLYALAFGGALATSMVGMVFAGGSADRHGPIRSLVIGLALFGGGLLMAGFAPSMAWLVAGRIAQGLGSGMLGVAIYVAMGRLLPVALRPRMFAAFAAAWVVPAIVGPGITGLLVETLGWRWLFLLVAALLVPCALMVVPPVARLPPPRAEGVAPAGAGRQHRLLWAALAASGALWLHQAARHPEAGQLPGVLLASILLGLTAMRLLPAGTLRAARGLPTVILLRGLLAAAFFCAEVFIPLWLTSERGWSITQAGLALTGGAVCWSLGSAIQARIEDPDHRLRWLRRGMLMVGIAIGCITAIVLSGAPAWMLIPAWIVTGLGIGVSFPMLSVLTLQLSAEHEQGANTSALQLSDALTTVSLMALSGAVFATLHASHPTLAFAGMFGAASLMGWVGAGLAGRCRVG